MTHLCAKQTFRFVGISLNADGVNEIYTCKIKDKFLFFILLLLILLIDNWKSCNYVLKMLDQMTKKIFSAYFSATNITGNQN